MVRVSEAETGTETGGCSDEEDGDASSSRTASCSFGTIRVSSSTDLATILRSCSFFLFSFTSSVKWLKELETPWVRRWRFRNGNVREGPGTAVRWLGGMRIKGAEHVIVAIFVP